MSGLVVVDAWRCYRWGWRSVGDADGEADGWEGMVEEDGVGEVPEEAAGEHRVQNLGIEMRLEVEG